MDLTYLPAYDTALQFLDKGRNHFLKAAACNELTDIINEVFDKEAELRSALDEAAGPYLIGFRDGLIEKQSSVEGFVKAAGPVMDSSSDLFDKYIGGGTGMAADIGTSFIPLVGSLKDGYSAVADAANMFGKGLSWKDRLGYGASALGNAGLAAIGLVPGAGGVVRNVLKHGGKAIARGVKAIAPKLTGRMASSGAAQTASNLASKANRARRQANVGLQRNTGQFGKYIAGKTDWQRNLRNKGMAGRMAASPLTPAIGATFARPGGEGPTGLYHPDRAMPVQYNPGRRFHYENYLN